MTYLEQLASRIQAAMGTEQERRDPADLFVLYALLAEVRGTDVTAKDVHDAWAAWKVLSGDDHDAVLPFAEIDPATQAFDEPYADAIRRVAAQVADEESGQLD